VTAADLAIIAGLVFAWGTLSARLERSDVTGPIAFTIVGLLLTHGPLKVLGVTPSRELIKGLAEATLALVLFTDASRVGLRHLRADLGPCARLLGIGLPLSIGLGTLLAFIVPGVTDAWVALIVGAALAPTDAALGAGMMVNPSVPARIRRIINVESGLNDGIATPFVLVGIAGAGFAEHVISTGAAHAVVELAVGVLAGSVIGGVGGWLVRVSRERDWVSEGFAGSAVLGLAACSYVSSVALHGNGFIAAFVGGLAFTAGYGPAAPQLPFVEETGATLSLLVWLLFGAVVLVPGLRDLTWQAAVYAVASLTVIRMLPVMIALAGAGLGRAAAVFIGWFGPRGLASVIFSLLVLEELDASAARPADTVITFTVLLSVFAHGLTANPLATRYGPRLAAPTGAPGPKDLAEVPQRRLSRRSQPSRP
jgi:NhaP-type Na+/H+ or K+/H+ antiporter